MRSTAAPSTTHPIVLASSTLHTPTPRMRFAEGVAPGEGHAGLPEDRLPELLDRLDRGPAIG